jgi:hypothetical protein
MLHGMSNLTMYGSMFLIGAALALAGGMGVLLPSGHRGVVLLALLAGAGVGIAGLAAGWSTIHCGSADSCQVEDWWRIFFICSIAGFAALVAALVVTWRRTRRQSADVANFAPDPTGS